MVLVGSIIGCQPASNSPAPDDLAYFPLQIGDFWVYQVTQNTYSSVNPVVEEVYQVQEKISSSYQQNGQQFFLMEESIRKTAQADWQLTTIRTVYKNQTEAVSLENNVPVIKLVFPIRQTTSWNANGYNTRPDTLLHYEDSGRSLPVGRLNFPNTVSVVGSEDSTLINLAKYRRVYALNVGLVYRENVALTYCQSTPACVGKALIESGSSQIWQLVASNRL